MTESNTERKTTMSDKISEGAHNNDKDILDFHNILANEAGQLGWYQIRTILLLAVGTICCAFPTTEYIFTTARIRTRCLIPECEVAGGDLQFSPSWILSAVPSSGTTFDSCSRYAANSSFTDVNNTCSANLFDDQIVTSCDQYVYENTNSIAYEFELACDEWRRTLIGSLRTMGVLIGMPICGLASDRWGRRTILVIASFNTAVLGLLRCTANTYVGFLISEIVESILGAGGYSCAFILMNEILGHKYGSTGGVMMSSYFSLGQATTALVAWGVPQWRMLTLTLYLPQFITIAYYWLLPESMRWQMGKGQYQEAINTLKNIARVNGRVLSEKSLEVLRQMGENQKRRVNEVVKHQEWLLFTVWRCKPVLLRCIVLPVWWISFVFIYYGLTINSVSISGNTYVNYVAVTLVEIPGFWLGFLLMNKIGRKPVITVGFWVCASCQFAYLFINTDSYGLLLSIYLVGKFSIAMVVITSYTYTTEMFPTSCRHRLFAFCSMIGRIGAIIAPLTPAFSPRLPFMLFGSLGVLAGLLALIPPETLGQPLPDTMADAAALGRKPKQTKL